MGRFCVICEKIDSVIMALHCTLYINDRKNWVDVYMDAYIMENWFMGI